MSNFPTKPTSNISKSDALPTRPKKINLAKIIATSTRLIKQNRKLEEKIRLTTQTPLYNIGA